MPAKRKPDLPRPTWQARAAATVKRHPGWSWSTIAAIGATLAIGGQFAVYALGFVQTTWGAERMENKLRGEMLAHVTLLRSETTAVKDELSAFKATVNRNMAWSSAQMLSMQATTSRNRVNDCNILKQKKGLEVSALEQAACAQYQQDMDDANRRLSEAQAAALKLSGSN